MYMTDERPTGVPTAQLGLHLHLDAAALDRKLTALRAMATQTGGLIQAVDPDVYALQAADETFVDAAPPPAHPVAGTIPTGEGSVPWPPGSPRSEAIAPAIQSASAGIDVNPA